MTLSEEVIGRSENGTIERSYHVTLISQREMLISDEID